MNLRDAILGFPEQLAWQPVVANAERLPATKRFLVAGMGGSNHATDLLKAWQPERDIIVHRDYDLPVLRDIERLIICCSYSGNTEETISAYEAAKARGFAVAVITMGGDLLAKAKADGVPYVAIPDTGMQPRSSSGFLLVALLALMGDIFGLAMAQEVGRTLNVAALEPQGQTVARELMHRVPLIYASTRNWALANNWKIQINENTKLSAFANVFPELNHNEMSGFAGGSETKKFDEQLAVIVLQDAGDDPRVVKRMRITAQVLQDQGVAVCEVKLLAGNNRLGTLLDGVVLASWTSLALAKLYGIDPEPVPLVEAFKTLMK